VIQGDERTVKQVVLNLPSNAIKITPEGGRIDVRAAITAGTVEIPVADTGVGIAPADQEAIFEEFRRWARWTRRWMAPASVWCCPGGSSSCTGPDLGEESGGTTLDLYVHAAGASRGVSAPRTRGDAQAKRLRGPQHTPCRRTNAARKHRATRGWIVILVTVAMAGCAGMQDTLWQDLAYARWRVCRAGSSFAQIDRVEPSGRIWFSYDLEIEKQSILACLAQQEGPPLPQPVATLRGKGGA